MILDGKVLAEKIYSDLKEKTSSLEPKPGLAVVLVGENPASKVYVNMKNIKCEKVGYYFEQHNLPENVSEEELIQLVEKLNSDSKINGILVQLPLPKHINVEKVISTISPEKDVDGFHPINFGKLFFGAEGFVPCTPLGVIHLLKENDIELSGKDVCIIGRSNIVGKPLVALFLKENTTVTVCHSMTKDLSEKTRSADIVVVAAGKKHLLTKDMVSPGAVVLDVGIQKVDGKIFGDVDFENVKEVASAISPVPGGVGPMTIASLLLNVMRAYENQRRN